MELTKLRPIELFIFLHTQIIVLLDLKIGKVNSVKRPTCARLVTHTWNTPDPNKTRHCLLKGWEAESNPEQLQKCGLWWKHSGVFFTTHPLQAQHKLQTAQMGRSRTAPPAFVASAFVSKRKNIGREVWGGRGLSSVASKLIGFLSAEPPPWKMLNLNSPLMRFCKEKDAGETWHQTAGGSKWETKRRLPDLIWKWNLVPQWRAVSYMTGKALNFITARFSNTWTLQRSLFAMWLAAFSGLLKYLFSKTHFSLCSTAG